MIQGNVVYDGNVRRIFFNGAIAFVSFNNAAAAVVQNNVRNSGALFVVF